MKLIKSLAAALCLTSALSACTQKSGDNNSKQKGDNMKTIHLTTAEFLNKVYNYETNPDTWAYAGDKPCLVDFYASWCGPCKALSPVLEELAAEYDGKIYIYKVDVDSEKRLAATFGIRSIPTLLWIPMKGKPTMTQGAMPRQDLKRMIDDVLLSEDK